LAQRPDKTLVVRETPAGLAAARSGVREGDEVLLIEGRDVRGMSSAEVHRTLSGDIGDPVKLTLIRGDQIVRISLQRTPARVDPLARRTPKIAEGTN
jgi:C-terminal processing protease CtpA/Prc